MARMVWCLALLRHAWAHALQCEEVTSITWAQVLVGLIMILLGIGIIYIAGCLYTHALLRTFQIPTTRALEEFLGQQPRLELLLKTLHVAVLLAGMAASIAVCLGSFAPSTEGFSTLQGSIVLPKHPVECAFGLLLPTKLPSVIHVLHCPMIILTASLAFCGACLLLVAKDMPFLQGIASLSRLLTIFLLGVAVVFALLISCFSTHRLPWVGLQVVPEEPISCVVHVVEAPVLFPVHAGANLSVPAYKHRQEYFVSLLLWLTVAAFLAGQLLTLMGRAWRGTSGAQYRALTSSVQISLVEHLSFHLLCAGLACFFVVTDRLDIYKGVGWEAYTMWVLVMLGSSILQALYHTLSLPFEARIPSFGKPIIEGILPVMGEHLDCFKDWIFIGIAVSTKNPLGYVFAVLACCILVLANLRQRMHYPEELARALLAVRSVCHPGRESSFLDKQTSPAKLAIALSEDLPQALLQSAFVVFFGGSATQFAFIAISVMKIMVCVSLRTVILKREDRHGEAWAASIEYYKFKIDIYTFILGRKHRWVLDAQTDLANDLERLGRDAEALELFEAVLEARREVLGRSHPETLDAEYLVGWSLARLQRGEEALQLFTEHLEACQEVFGARDPNTLWAQEGMAGALDKLGRPLEAAELKQEVFEVWREDLGVRDPETLKAQHNFAWSLRAAGRLQEALQQFEEVLCLEREVLGPKDPLTLRSQYGVARTLRNLGRHREAQKAYQELLTLDREVLGPQHPHTLETKEAYEELLQEVEASSP